MNAVSIRYFRDVSPGLEHRSVLRVHDGVRYATVYVANEAIMDLSSLGTMSVEDIYAMIASAVVRECAHQGIVVQRDGIVEVLRIGPSGLPDSIEGLSTSRDRPPEEVQVTTSQSVRSDGTVAVDTSVNVRSDVRPVDAIISLNHAQLHLHRSVKDALIMALDTNPGKVFAVTYRDDYLFVVSASPPRDGMPQINISIEKVSRVSGPRVPLDRIIELGVAAGLAELQAYSDD